MIIEGIKCKRVRGGLVTIEAPGGVPLPHRFYDNRDQPRLKLARLRTEAIRRGPPPVAECAVKDALRACGM